MFRGLRSAALCLVLTWGAPVWAGPRDVRLLPTELAPAGDGPPAELAPVAQRLEGALRDALLDFGLTPLEPLPQAAARDEEALVELARGSWVVAPELGREGGELRLRLRVVAPASTIVLVRAQRLDSAQLEVRSLGMLRELLEQPAGLPRDAAPAPAAALPLPPEPSRRSTGRMVLALHTAALGGYLGYSLQRASGSDDARLTYPLAALGAGIGLGSAMVVADEWDINLASAWYLGAAMFWPPLGISLANTGPDQPLLGVVGAVGGLSLATVGLAFGHVDEGGAAFTHSGAVIGLLLGGLGEMIVKGEAQSKPTAGMGYGILAGVTVAGGLATVLKTPSPTAMLTIDLSALLGGLGGAALGTPLLVSQESSEHRDRIWLSAVMLGTVVGAGVGYWITSDEQGTAPAASRAATGLASLRVELGSPLTPLGLGISGQW
jgi:hypothetical protein